MVLKLERLLGSKNRIAVLRFLVLQPYLTFGLTEISEKLQISKSNVLRVLGPLKEEKLVVERQKWRKKVVQVNGENRLVGELWKLFMIEKQSEIVPEFKNGVDLFYEKVKDKVEVFILFGSVAKGLAKEGSDIDVLVVGDEKVQGPVLDFLPYRLEVHNYSWGDLEKKRDFVVLDTLMKGVWYKGEVFNLVKELRNFTKSYLVYRLNKVKEFIRKGEKQKGETKKYYLRLAEVTLGEIESLYKKKTILSKKEIKEKVIFKKVEELERELAKEGEKIWLI